MKLEEELVDLITRDGRCADLMLIRYPNNLLMWDRSSISNTDFDPSSRIYIFSNLLRSELWKYLTFLNRQIKDVEYKIRDSNRGVFMQRKKDGTIMNLGG